MKQKAIIHGHQMAGGLFSAVGFDGTISGKGANLFIIDDPIKNSQSAGSEADEHFRRSTYLSAVQNRLEPYQGLPGRIIVVTTRWPGDAFTGWLLESDGAVYLNQQYLKQIRN